MKRRRWWLGTLAALACSACPAADSAFTLTVENDKFTGSDNNYSNGIGLSWSTGELEPGDSSSLLQRWAGLWRFLPWIGDRDHRTYASWTLGQEMHTPNDIRLPNPPLDDQPYAGILYVDTTLHARRQRWGHTFNVRLGVVGPASHADWTQRHYHDLIDADEPLGWDTQLPNELLVNLDYTAGYVWRDHALTESLSWRLIPNVSFGLGNYFTGLSAGLYGEIGWHLSDALAFAALRNGISTMTTVGSGRQEHWTLSLFAGVTGFAVGHYLPLDGTVFHDSRSVDTTRLVGQVTGGFALRKRAFVMSFSQTYFSETFATERERSEFGTLSLSWYF